MDYYHLETTLLLFIILCVGSLKYFKSAKMHTFLTYILSTIYICSLKQNLKFKQEYSFVRSPQQKKCFIKIKKNVTLQLYLLKVIFVQLCDLGLAPKRVPTLVRKSVLP